MATSKNTTNPAFLSLRQNKKKRGIELPAVEDETKGTPVLQDDFDSVSEKEPSSDPDVTAASEAAGASGNSHAGNLDDDGNNTGEDQEVMNIAEQISEINEKAAVQQSELDTMLGGIDLKDVSSAVLIEVAIRCAAAADVRHRELLEQQRRVASQIQRLVTSMGGHLSPTMFGNGAAKAPRKPRRQRVGTGEGYPRISRFIYRNPDSPSMVWRGVGAKPSWLRELEEREYDIAKIREPNPDYVPATASSE